MLGASGSFPNPSNAIRLVWRRLQLMIRLANSGDVTTIIKVIVEV
jgi:hypothetical protein